MRADARLEQLFAHEGVATSFLADVPIRRGQLDGQAGLFLTVRLTSYRALPLSCIEDASVTLDGTEYRGDALALVLNGVVQRPSEFSRLPDRWWFILDTADLFVPAGDLADGEHDVAATLVTVEPYMTAGRFSFHHPDRRRLAVAKG